LSEITSQFELDKIIRFFPDKSGKMRGLSAKGPKGGEIFGHEEIKYGAGI
jgi:hypothetical protein